MMPWSEEGKAAARSGPRRAQAAGGRAEAGDRLVTAPRTLFDKVWDAHVVQRRGRAARRRCCTWICTWCTRSPRPRRSRGCDWRAAACAGRSSRSPRVDHNVSTGDRRLPIADQISARQVARAGQERAGVRGRALRPREPGAGDRPRDRPRAGHHPARAWSSSAATPTPPPTAPSAPWPSASARARWSTCSPRSASSSPGPARWRCASTGVPSAGVTAKDLVLALIRRIGTAGATGHVDRVHRRGHPRRFRWKAG